jgi:hypothetical protein
VRSAFAPRASASDRGGDLVLHRKDISQLAIVAFRPHVRPVSRIDQLRLCTGVPGHSASEVSGQDDNCQVDSDDSITRLHLTARSP